MYTFSNMNRNLLIIFKSEKKCTHKDAEATIKRAILTKHIKNKVKY